MSKPLIYKVFTTLYVLLFSAFSGELWASETTGQTAEKTIIKFLESAAENQGADIQVEILTGLHQLDVCENAEPFLPSSRGTGLGRVQVGVRCNNGQFTRYVQAQVSAMGTFLVAAEEISSGTRVTSDLIQEEYGDISQLPRQAILDSTALTGHESRRTIRKGTVLQENMFVLPPLISRGQTVVLEAGGSSFTITREGEAIDSGALGDYIRVRVGQREVVTGRIISATRVKVD